MRDVDRRQVERKCSGMNYKVQNGLIEQPRFTELAVALAILTLGHCSKRQLFLFSPVRTRGRANRSLSLSPSASVACMLE